MVNLLLTLLRILFPLDPVARLREITRDYIRWIVDPLHDPRALKYIATNARARAEILSHIIVAEHGIQLLIHERARQLAGLPYLYTPRSQRHAVHKDISTEAIVARLSRMAKLFHDFERLAQRRAERLKRELKENPLRLPASPASTSPSLRLVEATLRSLASLSAKHCDGLSAEARSAQAEGGSPRTRGPPITAGLPIADCRLPLKFSFRDRTLMPVHHNSRVNAVNSLTSG